MKIAYDPAVDALSIASHEKTVTTSIWLKASPLITIPTASWPASKAST
jgi:hypothetical protein